MKRLFEALRLKQFPIWPIFLAGLLVHLPTLGEPRFLEPEQAFQLSVQETGEDKAINLQWKIAPGYYLYRDRIGVNGQGVGTVTRPAGESKEDPNFGVVEVYRTEVGVQVDAGAAKRLDVTWQGCAEDGLCYPPEKRAIALASASPVSAATAALAPKTAAPAVTAGLGSDTQFNRILNERSLLWTVPLFFVLGIALAFTPCVLPMVPILSSIVIGSGATPQRGLFLSLAFVVPMAAVYAGLGMLAALAGASLQAMLQSPWTVLSFSVVFVVLALSMFGFYELQLPAFLRNRLARSSARGGSLAGAATMGVLSAVLVGPCMTAPLAGTLLYIAQGGRTAEGVMLLFVLGLGMGVPLVVISTMGARWLPRPGSWMNRIKAAFGFLLLAVAVWMADRVLPSSLTVLLWGALLIAVALSLWAATAGAATDVLVARPLLARSVAAVAGLWGAAMVLGAAAGASDPVRPLDSLLKASASASTSAMASKFEIIQDPALLQARLDAAAAGGRPALVEFSADWCTSCKTIEHEVFGDPRVDKALESFVLLRADVTRSDAAQRAYMRNYQVMGPPTLLLFDQRGQEQREQRLVGEFAPETLLQHIAAKGGSS
jgi:thiol:disulfide interchange protein DsbD